jgi:hypothetical protein
MAHEFNGIAASTTATAIPNLLPRVDGKSVMATTSRARTDQFAALTLKLQPEPGDGIRHRHVWHEHFVSKLRHDC